MISQSSWRYAGLFLAILFRQRPEIPVESGRQRLRPGIFLRDRLVFVARGGRFGRPFHHVAGNLLAHPENFLIVPIEYCVVTG